jgi:thiosulfate/3-mercaptopyruvate sulfurtransferase
MKLRSLAVIAGTLLSAIATFAQPRASLLVSTAWLAGHLGDPNLVVLQVARQRADYDRGHIPGARFLALGDIMVTRNGKQNELPPAADLEQVFERAGVGDRSRVVLYGEMSGLFAARAYFTLDYLGHGDRAALLDGGLEKWRAEQRPISTDAPPITPATFTPVIPPEVLVALTAVRDFSRAKQNDPRAPVALLDARPLSEFNGTAAFPGVPRAGHIPAAMDLYWKETLTGGDAPVLLPVSALRKKFAQAGVASGQKVITYCVSGVQASFLYFVARYLGYDAALYDGSFAEWSSAGDTAVVAGK